MTTTNPAPGERVLFPYAGAVSRGKAAREWRDDEDAVLVGMVLAGRSAQEASNAIGRTRPACVARALRVGQPFNGSRHTARSVSGQFIRVAERYFMPSMGVGQSNGGPT